MGIGTLSQKWNKWASRQKYDFFPGHVVKNRAVSENPGQTVTLTALHMCDYHAHCHPCILLSADI